MKFRHHLTELSYKAERLTFWQFLGLLLVFMLVATALWKAVGLPMPSDQYKSCWTTDMGTRLCTTKSGSVVEP